MREAFRVQWAGMQPGWSMVINPRRNVLTADFDELKREVKRVMDRCGK